MEELLMLVASVLAAFVLAGLWFGLWTLRELRRTPAGAAGLRELRMLEAEVHAMQEDLAPLVLRGLPSRKSRACEPESSDAEARNRIDLLDAKLALLDGKVHTAIPELLKGDERLWEAMDELTRAKKLSENGKAAVGPGASIAFPAGPGRRQ